MTDTALLDAMMAAAATAGQTIMDIYAEPIDARRKADGSPVTVADHKAEQIIIDALSDTGLPILAEESVSAGRVPKLGPRYFIVDPLDGTKEFLKRNGEFTVNIALVEHGRPVLGVVTAPAINKAFCGGPSGAFEFALVDGQYSAKRPIQTDPDGEMTMVASRTHGHDALAPLADLLAVKADVSVGSSLKFGLVADGTARVYPRFTPTCEWDTAAGQAVLEAAGGVVLTLKGLPLTYGKTGVKFLNPFFVAAADLALGQHVAAEMLRIVGDNV